MSEFGRKVQELELEFGDEIGSRIAADVADRRNGRPEEIEKHIKELNLELQILRFPDPMLTVPEMMERRRRRTEICLELSELQARKGSRK